MTIIHFKLNNTFAIHILTGKLSTQYDRVLGY